jgi:hypothetical protein
MKNTGVALQGWLQKSSALTSPLETSIAADRSVSLKHSFNSPANIRDT